jgi:hypothetical protein
MERAIYWLPIDGRARNGERWLIKTRWWGAREASWCPTSGMWQEPNDVPGSVKPLTWILDEHVTAYAPLPNLRET